METVATLRAKGWRVGVHHQYYDGDERTSPKGRDLDAGWRSDVFLTEPGGERAYRGAACCNPNDAYNRRLGLTIALGRALKAYGQNHG